MFPARACAYSAQSQHIGKRCTTRQDVFPTGFEASREYSEARVLRFGENTRDILNCRSGPYGICECQAHAFGRKQMAALMLRDDFQARVNGEPQQWDPQAGFGNGRAARAPPLDLLSPERDGRIDAARAARRQVARDGRHSEHAARNDDPRWKIEWPDTEQHCRKKSRNRKCA